MGLTLYYNGDRSDISEVWHIDAVSTSSPSSPARKSARGKRSNSVLCSSNSVVLLKEACDDSFSDDRRATAVEALASEEIFPRPTPSGRKFSYFCFDIPEQMHHVLSIDVVVEPINWEDSLICVFDKAYGVKLNEIDVMSLLTL